MMKQLGLWPWALRKEPPVLMSSARSAEVVERESYLLEYQGLLPVGSAGRAFERLVITGAGPILQLAPAGIVYKINRRVYLREVQKYSAQHKYDGLTNGLISRQLNLQLREYCMCLNTGQHTGPFGVSLECLEAACCVASPPA